MAVGRFAPSPTGLLHLGNLRTALVAWLFARSAKSEFLVRMEDLDPVTSSRDHEEIQLLDLAAFGLDWDASVVRQSERLDLYRDAISELSAKGLVYPCWCSRREIAEASQAPNQRDLPEGAYPGTCRELSSAEREARRESGKPPALRIRSDGSSRSFVDAIHGDYTGGVDDVVLARADGMAAYNLAVVIDDALQGVRQVVRGDDLLSSTPRQMLLGELLGFPPVSYAHIPLVLNREGKRLAKRDGAVSLSGQLQLGCSPAEVCGILAASVGLGDGSAVQPRELLDEFRNVVLPTAPWHAPDELIGGS